MWTHAFGRGYRRVTALPFRGIPRSTFAEPNRISDEWVFIVHGIDNAPNELPHNFQIHIGLSRDFGQYARDNSILPLGDRFEGIIVSSNNGSMALVGEPGENLYAVEQKLRSKLTWQL